MSEHDTPGEYIGQGCWLERNIEIPRFGKVDVLRIPNWSVERQLNAGTCTPESIHELMGLWSQGHSAGLALGRKQVQDEIRKALGIAT